MKQAILIFILLVFAKPLYSQVIDLGQTISQVQDSLKMYHIPYDTIDLGKDRKDRVVIKIKKKNIFGLSGDEYIEFGVPRVVGSIDWVYDSTATVETAYKFSWNVRKRLYKMITPESIKKENYLFYDYWSMPDRKAWVSLSDKGELSFTFYVPDYGYNK